ncbi:MAG: high-potential iron-sulfur protein [Paraglaciecola sp.]|uniref:high-potential iron-sulfur protein n=1 Tax=Pseudomonadati TaxID=3379134 RepID=UPI00273EE7C4|nr:high-potential iron-sulfur protein [Paraglaciecola sp.]MDP5032940.1 high-potential iron-sulfur protein [Paraglaciecola sp.]MDP5133519.1 high-potential iron-sulfur protein [Paraglaciecola sp.]
MSNINRRKFLKFSAGGLVGVTLGGVSLRVAAEERLSEDDVTAKALKYVHKTPVEGAVCANCMQIKGADGEAWRGCNIFPGKLVNANGWCAAWMKKPA